MSLHVDLFWSFRSPYSYLLMPRLLEFRESYDVDINACVVYPLAVRDPELLKRLNPLYVGYMLGDTRRTAEYLGMTITSPDPDPVDFDRALKGFSQAQPRIERLMRLAAAAQERGRALEFIDQVSRLLFGGTTGWDTGDHLQRAAERAGLVFTDLEARIETDSDRLDQLIEVNHQAQQAAGHWGVPLLVFQGEPFFGQDRFDQLVWRLQQHGLETRG
jgi:2-hydroxychromene-2-carboxylate isomerase